MKWPKVQSLYKDLNSPGTESPTIFLTKKLTNLQFIVFNELKRVCAFAYYMTIDPIPF